MIISNYKNTTVTSKQYINTLYSKKVISFRYTLVYFGKTSVDYNLKDKQKIFDTDNSLCLSNKNEQEDVCDQCAAYHAKKKKKTEN